MTPEQKAQELLVQGYKQTSRKFRMLAKVPDGYTPIQALRRASPTEAKRVEEQFHRWASDAFMRLSNKNAVPEFSYCYIEIDQETFDAFRRLGGTTL